jgi:hypothetical protein
MSSTLDYRTPDPAEAEELQRRKKAWIGRVIGAAFVAILLSLGIAEMLSKSATFVDGEDGPRIAIKGAAATQHGLGLIFLTGLPWMFVLQSFDRKIHFGLYVVCIGLFVLGIVLITTIQH